MTQLVLHACDATLNEAAPTHQRAVLADPWSRPIGQRNLITGEELRQHLRVELVALALALGDNSQLLRVRQNYSLSQRLYQLHEPFVAGGSFHDDLEFA